MWNLEHVSISLLNRAGRASNAYSKPSKYPSVAPFGLAVALPTLSTKGALWPCIRV